MGVEIYLSFIDQNSLQLVFMKMVLKIAWENFLSQV